MEDFDRLVESVCLRPQFFHCCGRGLSEVVAYLKGYSDGAFGGSYRDDTQGPLRGFNRFVTEQFDRDRNVCWDHVIIEEFGKLDAEQALDAFRALYQSFQASRQTAPMSDA